MTHLCIFPVLIRCLRKFQPTCTTATMLVNSLYIYATCSMLKATQLNNNKIIIRNNYNQNPTWQWLSAAFPNYLTIQFLVRTPFKGFRIQPFLSFPFVIHILYAQYTISWHFIKLVSTKRYYTNYYLLLTVNKHLSFSAFHTYKFKRKICYKS